jgi:pyruvate,water dikinase
MLTCASSSLGAHLALKTLLSRVSPIDADRLAQALTAGIRDLESARPAMGLMRVVLLAQDEPEARAAIERESTTGLDGIPDGPTRRALVSFLELYGDRAVREPELSTPRWKEDPRAVLTMLRVALRPQAGGSDSRDPHRALEHAHAVAETETQRVLDRMNFVEQTALRHLVARAQKAARMRERMRGWVTRVLGLIREVLLDADRRLLRLMPELATSGSIPSVFFLTVDEVVGALRNARADLAPLVRLRRAEYARDLARPDPPVTFVGAPLTAQPPPTSGEVLRGTPASSGVVEGRVRVLLSADMSDFQPGEILVVRTTDVGWTPLFLLATGVLTELGGALSHAAIVAREFGVPSVVNVPGVTRLLRTGDRVRVDGDHGTIERLPAA